MQQPQHRSIEALAEQALPLSVGTVSDAYRDIMQLLVTEQAMSPTGSINPGRARELVGKIFKAPPTSERWRQAASLLQSLGPADLIALGGLLEDELLRRSTKADRRTQYLRLEQGRRRVFTDLLENLQGQVEDFESFKINIPYAASFLAQYCFEEYFEDGAVIDYEKLWKRVEPTLDALIDIPAPEGTPEEVFLHKLQAAIHTYLATKELEPAKRALDAEYAVRDIEMIALITDWGEVRAALIKTVDGQAAETFGREDVPTLVGALRAQAEAVVTQKLELAETDFDDDLVAVQTKFEDHIGEHGSLSKEDAVAIVEDQFYLYKLNIGNPGIYNQYPSDEMIKTIVGGVKACSAYDHHAGAKDVKELAAEFYNLYLHNQNAAMPVDYLTLHNIVVGNGASEVIEMFLTALVENGENAIGTSPIYPLYSSVMGKLGEELKTVTLDVTDQGEVKRWEFDVEGLKALIDFNTKVLCINSPNNPTGAVFSRESLEAILDLAEEYGLFVISDEIYCEDLYDDEAQEKFCSMGSLAYERGVPAVIISGISKGLGKAAGWRCGWGVFIDRDNKAGKIFDAANTVATARLNPNTLGQRGAVPVLEDLIKYERRVAANIEADSTEAIDRSDLETLHHLDKLRALTGTQKDAMYEAFNVGPLSMPKPDGAYYGFFKVEGIDDFEAEK